jgi:beta-glucosidase-like glycosyl hydrolase
VGCRVNQVMGDIKHYALNDQETGRTVVNVLLGRKAMRESDLLAFEIGIRIGHPASAMCSYNKINGDWACENDYLLNHVLKGNWKFPGLVVSDWEATHTQTGKGETGSQHTFSRPIPTCRNDANPDHRRPSSWSVDRGTELGAGDSGMECLILHA